MSATKTSPLPATPDGDSIGGTYTVLSSQPLAGMGGGQPAYAVQDRRHGRGDLMAVRVAPGLPARPQPLTVLAGAGGTPIANLLGPVAFGPGHDARGEAAAFVICPRPPGPAVWPDDAGGSVRPWAEADLIDNLVRPAALVLEALAEKGVTHRAIRPNNVFRVRGGAPVTLGCAWAAPPASLQPSMFEPPYMAMCHLAGRGDGAIGDDVYALGVLLVTLASGRIPMAGLDDEAVIRRKLTLGSFAAVVGDLRLPPGIHDLARGMLAEDPEHRPPPALLADTVAARVRRVTARPPQRAQRPLEVGEIGAWDARGLAYAMARAPDQAARLLRTPAVDGWLRRSLPDPGLAARIEEAVHQRAAESGDPALHDAVLVMRAVAILDPLAPLCWRGVSLFPDGLGPMLAQTGEIDRGGALTERLESLVAAEAVPAWGEARGERSDLGMLRLDARQQRLVLRIAGWAGGLLRLRYMLNPLLPCTSPILRGACVVRIGDLLAALETAASGGASTLLDREIGAFVAARFTGRADSDLLVLTQEDHPDVDPPGRRAMAQLRILADLQARDQEARMPALAARMHEAVTPALRQWRNRSVRAGRERALAEAVAQGNLVAMVAVIEDRSARADDQRAAEHAQAELAQIAIRLAEIANAAGRRAAQARTTGQEIGAAIGLMALAASAVATMLS